VQKPCADFSYVFEDLQKPSQICSSEIFAPKLVGVFVPYPLAEGYIPCGSGGMICAHRNLKK